MSAVWSLTRKSFQSTPSARRATASSVSARSRSGNFNPRPPRGERRISSHGTQSDPYISIHALREESDGDETVPMEFFVSISIHALREESDSPRLRPLSPP